MPLPFEEEAPASYEEISRDTASELVDITDENVVSAPESFLL